MGKSRIDWTERTWEPVLGCSRVSPGCENCYAERLIWRLAHHPTIGDRYAGLVHLLGGKDDGERVHGGRPRWTRQVRLDEGALAAPLRWREPSRIFVCSRSDLFHESVPDESIAAVFGVMAAAPQHTFQVLTKRADRMRRWFESLPERLNGPAWWCSYQAACIGANDDAAHDRARFARWPLPNVWLGVTAEDQERADERLADLLATPAAVRFVSYEPALGPVDFSPWLDGGTVACEECGNEQADMGRRVRCEACGYGPMPTRTEPVIDWLIAGGESGPGARPCDVAWIRSVVEQCKAAGTACFVKQLGARPIAGSRGVDGLRMGQIDPGDHGHGDHHVSVRLRHRSGADPAEWPADLRVREWPEAVHD